MGGNAAEDEDGFSGDVLEEGEGEEGLGVAGGRGGERVAGGEGVGGGLSDGEGWDGGGGGGVSGCGFGGDEDGEVGEGEGGDWGVGGLGGEVADDDGGSEEGLVSALRQFRREVLRAVERTSEPNGGRGTGGSGHGRIIPASSCRSQALLGNAFCEVVPIGGCPPTLCRSGVEPPTGTIHPR